ncbi:MAG: phosphohydrolase [Chitinophagales bacterium]|nr:phosphohydrolase [Chitinophagales bacterium]
MENPSALLKAARDHASQLISANVSPDASFHTLQHTQDVVAASEKIAAQELLPEEDALALYVAAWFHDTGYSAGKSRDHELVSVQHAADFFDLHPVPDDFREKVKGCILATRMPQNPQNKLEEILCDADLFHLGSPNFKEKSRLLREELELFNGEEWSKKEWRKNNIAFLEAHNYFTAFGRKVLQPVKEEHLNGLLEKNPPEKIKASKEKKKEDGEDDDTDLPEEDQKTKRSKEKKTERGISTVFRIMAQNQSNLSQMADSKANILISVNSIILTIVISTLSTKLESNSYLQIPVIILVTVCVSAIVFSILATRPNVTHGTFTPEDIQTKKTNLLFFGNFYKMSLPDYDWAMQELLADKSYLYSSLVKDNYFLGVVLAKKYRWLRIAYNVFMFGIVIAMVAFAVAVAVPQATEVYVPG